MLLHHGVEHRVLRPVANVRGCHRRGRSHGSVCVSGPCILHATRETAPGAWGNRPASARLSRAQRSCTTGQLAFIGAARAAEMSAIVPIDYCNDASRAGHRLFRTEGARRTSQESLRSNEIAELRHRDASQRERRRVVTQGDPLQCAKGITRCERTRRGGDQRVHRNPVTLVTLTIRYSGAKLAHDQQRAIGSDGVALQPEGPGARPIRRLQRP